MESGRPFYRPLDIGDVICSRFKLGKKLACGSFGDIILGYDLQDNGEPVAMKLEFVDEIFGRSQLDNEFSLYFKLKGVVGIPEIKWFGFITESRVTVLVMSLLGPSLEDLFNFCGRKFSLKTTLMLADQLLRRIEAIHSKGIIHRDIKPGNCLVGRDWSKNEMFVVDYGLAKRYCSHRGVHIPYRENKSMKGTARYASLNCHSGIEQSCRDDLESLGYTLIYFNNGQLPWQGIKVNNRRQKFQLIAKLMGNISIAELTKDCPEEFRLYMNYVRYLQFGEKPHYKYLRKLFRTLFFKQGYTDTKYDWSLLAEMNKMSSTIGILPSQPAIPMIDKCNTEETRINSPQKNSKLKYITSVTEKGVYTDVDKSGDAKNCRDIEKNPAENFMHATAST